jgi:hypothetical protein
MPTTPSEPTGEKTRTSRDEEKEQHPSSPNIEIQGIRLSARFFHVYPVFESNFLRQLLSNLGYTWVVKEPPRVDTLGLEAVLSGTVARKDGISIEYSTDKQVIVVSGNNPNRVIGSFEQIIFSLQETIEPVKLKIFFYETLVSALAQGNKSPLEVFSAESNELKKKEELDKIFEEPVSQFALRIRPPNRPIDNTDWFEYTIEPLYYQVWKIYTISMVYRNKDLKPVIDALSRFEDRMKRTILTLEE